MFVFAIFALLFSVVLFYLSSATSEQAEKLEKERDVVESLSVVSSPSAGLIKIKGRPLSIKGILKAPLVGTEVIYYHHHIMELRERYSSFRGRRRTETSWETVVDKSDSVEEFVVNGVKVVPKGASFYGIHPVHKYDGRREETLHIVPAGSELIVVGNCRSTDDGLRIDGGEVFVISSLSDEELLNAIAEASAEAEKASVITLLFGIVALIIAVVLFAIPFVSRRKGLQADLRGDIGDEPEESR